MKVIAVMEVSPTDGGGFYQAMNAVQQMKRLCEGRHSFSVGVTHPGTRDVLTASGIESFELPISLFDRWRFLVSGRRETQRTSNDGAPARSARDRPGWVQAIRGALPRSIPDIVGVEAKLSRHGADLVYFVAPWSRPHALETLCYWITVWDLAHVQHFEFPELASAYRVREEVLDNAMGRAAVVIADSRQSATLIAGRYGVQAERIVPMSFLPAANLGAADQVSTGEVMAHFGLEPGYLFYPAQFWAHKNHVRIIEALRLCADRGHAARVVFAGGDKGGRSYIEALVERLGLQASVRFLGFVDDRFMHGLYAASHALVMPTYFGPTNLPPLEAWTLDIPLIYSRHLAEQAGDAALLVDPDDADDLAAAMMMVAVPDVRARLIHAGRRRLEALAAEREAAERELGDHLRRLESRLRCSRPMSSQPASRVRPPSR